MRLLLNLSPLLLLAGKSSTTLLQLESPVQEDGTIRFPGFPDFCVYKRWNDYIQGQDVWSWPCADIDSPNEVKRGKLQWSYNSTTKLVKSIGSEIMRPHKPFCWNLVTPGRTSQKLKIKACDENNPNQKFIFDANGRFVPEADMNLCVQYDMKNSAGNINQKSLKLQKCWGGNFMRIHQVVPNIPTTQEPTSQEPTTEEPTTQSPTTTTQQPTTTSNLLICGANSYDPEVQQCCETTVGYNYLLPANHVCNPNLYQKCADEFYSPGFGVECCTFNNASKVIPIGTCNNCEIGYHFDEITFTCEENTCYCENGIPARARHCGDPEMDPSHERYDPNYSKRCCFEHNTNSCQACSAGYHGRHDWVQCLPNKCYCDHGRKNNNQRQCPSNQISAGSYNSPLNDFEFGEEFHKDRFQKCTADCDSGYHLENVFNQKWGFNETVCVPTTCRCDFGTAGSDCTDRDSNSCVSCDAGYDLVNSDCIDTSNQYMPSPQNELLATTLLRRFMENEKVRRHGLSVHEALHATPNPHIIRLSFHANTGLSDGCVDFNKTNFNKGLDQIYYRIHNWYNLYEATFNFFKSFNNSVISNSPYNVTETMILENEIDRNVNFRSYRFMCIEGENPDRFMERGMQYCHDQSRTFHSQALHDEFIRKTGVQNNHTFYTASAELDPNELWQNYLHKFYFYVYKNNTLWDENEPIIGRADFLNILYTEAYHDMTPNFAQQQCVSGRMKGMHEYSDTPDVHGGPSNAKWYKGCYQYDYENGIRGNNWPSTGIFGNDTKPTLQPTNLELTKLSCGRGDCNDLSGDNARNTKFWVGATHGPIIHLTRNYGRVDAQDRGNCPIEIYSDDEITYAQNTDTPAAEELFSTNAPIMGRLFPGMKSWEFGALLGGHSVGAVHRDISGFTTGQWVSCGNKKITTRFFGRFASQGYSAVQCTDCNEMGHGEFHTVNGRDCGGGAEAYLKWQKEYLAGNHVEAILPKVCKGDNNDFFPNKTVEGLAGLDALKAKIDYESCPSCAVADMQCGIDKDGARGQAIIGLILDISQFRKDVYVENGKLYKEKGSVHVNGDQKFHPAGEQVVWARDQPTNYDESWEYSDKSRWANYFVPHSTASLIDPNPSHWKNNTDWDVDFYFDFTRSAQKMLNNGYLGDFGAHKRGKALWDSKNQEETWRQMCLDMWAPEWRRNTNGNFENDLEWKTYFPQQEHWCRRVPDYHPLEDGYDLGVEPEFDPDAQA